MELCIQPPHLPKTVVSHCGILTYSMFCHTNVPSSEHSFLNKSSEKKVIRWPGDSQGLLHMGPWVQPPEH